IERVGAVVQVSPGLLPRRHDPVIEPRRHAELSDAATDIVGAARRVRQQHDALSLGQEPRHAVDDAGKRRHPVMHDPPQVEDDAVVIGGDLAHPVNEANGHDGDASTSRLISAWSEPTAAATEANPSRSSNSARPRLISPISAGPWNTSAV